MNLTENLKFRQEGFYFMKKYGIFIYCEVKKYFVTVQNLKN